ncbi:hypothetical protein Tco_0506379 [Tanacetum coccineum]
MPSHPGTPYWQTHMPSHSATPNWQTPLPSHPHDVGLFNLGDKTKNKAKNANVSPLNLGNSFVDDNVRDDDVMFMGERVTDNYFVHENVDPSKVRREEYLDCGKFLLNPYVVYFDCHMMGYLVSEKFWRELVPHLYMAGFHSLNSLRKRLCAGEEPIVHGDSQTFWENIRYQMLLMFYQCRYEDTRNCGYD